MCNYERHLFSGNVCQRKRQTDLIDLITTDVVVIRSYSAHRMILNLFAFEQRVFIIAMLEILFGDIFF